MITEIGIVAGDIWNLLEKQGQVCLEDLFSGIGKSKELTLMSLGWLARENHVLVDYADGAYRVSLKNNKD